MKNVINYYYNLYPENIFQNKDEYYFFINNIRYTFIEYKEDLKEIDKIYNMHLNILKRNMYVHPIILNKDGKALTMIKEKPYILMQTVYYGEKITMHNIISFSSVEANTNKETTWEELWKNKNDYLEYQINLLGNKYKILKKSMYYYLGLGENAIQLLNITQLKNIRMYYSHKRIDRKNTTYDLYNPLNINIDTKVRDIAEYLKQSFFSKENIEKDLEYYLKTSNLTVEEHILFFSRMLYPTYYYDMVEKILKNEKQEKEILNIINKVDEYQNIIKKLYKYYKTFINFPLIEWLE